MDIKNKVKTRVKDPIWEKMNSFYNNRQLILKDSCKEGIAYFFACTGLICIASIIAMVILDIRDNIFTIQDFIILSVGSFGAYVYIMRIFFIDDIDRRKRIQIHIYGTIIGIFGIFLLDCFYFFIDKEITNTPFRIVMLSFTPIFFFLLLCSIGFIYIIKTTISGEKD